MCGEAGVHLMLVLRRVKQNVVQIMNCAAFYNFIVVSYSCSNSGIYYRDLNSWYRHLLFL